MIDKKFHITKFIFTDNNYLRIASRSLLSSWCINFATQNDHSLSVTPKAAKIIKIRF